MWRTSATFPFISTATVIRLRQRMSAGLSGATSSRRNHLRRRFWISSGASAKSPPCRPRGCHRCDLCVPSPSTTISVIRDGFKVALGSAEIRVLSKENTSTIRERLRTQEPGLLFLRKSLGTFDVYAAPNLIYHYVEVHHYKPPNEFFNALRGGRSRQIVSTLSDLKCLGWSGEKPLLQ